MRDSKMMETSPACKNTQTDNTSQMKKKKSTDAFIWPWINGSYKVCSVFTEHSLGLWDIKHREKNFESHLNMESCIAFSERKSKQRAVIWTCSGVRWRWHQMYSGWPVITLSTMAVFVLVWRFFSGLYVLVIQGNVNTDGKLSFYNHLHPWKARGKTNNISHGLLCWLWMWRHYSLIKCTSRHRTMITLKPDIYTIFKRLWTVYIIKVDIIRLAWFIWYGMGEYGAQNKEKKTTLNQLNSDS